MAITTRQRLLLETNALRDKAEALLKGLEDAKRITERELARFNRVDAMECVRGRSSLDQGIVSTRRMIETLNQSLANTEQRFDDDDLALLDEIERVDEPNAVV